MGVCVLGPALVALRREVPGQAVPWDSELAGGPGGTGKPGRRGHGTQSGAQAAGARGQPHTWDEADGEERGSKMAAEETPVPEACLMWGEDSPSTQTGTEPLRPRVRELMEVRRLPPWGCPACPVRGQEGHSGHLHRERAEAYPAGGFYPHPGPPLCIQEKPCKEALTPEARRVDWLLPGHGAVPLVSTGHGGEVSRGWVTGHTVGTRPLLSSNAPHTPLLGRRVRKCGS